MFVFQDFKMDASYKVRLTGGGVDTTIVPMINMYWMQLGID